MSPGLLILIILCTGIAGLVLGRRRALLGAQSSGQKLHSLPMAYGQSVFLFATVPALLLVAVWLLLQPVFLEGRAAGMIPASDIPAGSGVALLLDEARRIAGGLPAAAATLPSVLAAAEALRAGAESSRQMLSLAALALSLGGAVWAFLRIRPEARARNLVEQFILAMLMGASLIAILTTFAIVASLIFETVHFFQVYEARDFFLSLTWSPRFGGGSQLGLWPLLWGTLYISFIALLFAVPVGLMAAIYLSEYAGPRMRALAKPLIEILAGIPTIVYGLFALITVGPLLRDYLAQPMGLGDSSSSVLTAGLVMGIMLIPFVSSLSDDIINAVPQAMRDGSYGLGATQSETIRQVVLPAALPGVVGAVLLAASRAIGETMIVVMGAGAAAKLDLNPFEAMTTITVKIVSQLTGDTEFASPETLVAFALGLTLFIFTLGLNILALVIVRKYREQYE
ncbi:phosphate ABC transporter permease subunit PstC [Falsigemmobacter intermedius]|uniref:Phosphate transport system permease protein n=1 Tax=Falsigemmobacter intermedius TaxID=1553448 RepID=A0A444MAS4_9RHOB|nr:phosphate ABC transporter permease subunit PstC [Falsigemmobacter intermedius]RWY40575.1 phosphate ABC transporter permease subunit PstC [Falsigemmobacter intermedius]